ncbi:unnamed protein product [Brassica oleracea]
MVLSETCLSSSTQERLATYISKLEVIKTRVIRSWFTFDKLVNSVQFIHILTKYCLEAKIVKTLGDGDIWNNLLTTKNIRNNKKLLAGIKALPEANYDQICEAVDDIMASLTSEVQIFIEKTLVSLEEMYDKKR